ncbi:MAG: hypothetical protein GDA43_07155 [Hormoscilla sp. SP5CHS1]|nr:hypothetical protein [Hormoscilla sp. SP12CHS1]MBC6453009.1 hypothetical protein [Hormoscilla sp. SP5CHS1]
MTGSLDKSSAALHAIALTIVLALISGHYNFQKVPIANKFPALVVQIEPDAATTYPEIMKIIK